MKRVFSVSHSVTDSEQWKALSPAAKVLYVTLCKLSDLFKNDKGWYQPREKAALASSSTAAKEPTTATIFRSDLIINKKVFN